MSNLKVPQLDFTGKVCVVTGAAGGIGRDIALSFAMAGAKVGVFDYNAEGCRETAAQIAESGGTAIAVACDVSSESSIAAGAKRVYEELGECDIVVNNAGIIGYGRLESVTRQDWERMMSVNLTGYLLVSQAFVPAMLERRRGTFVHVASIAATEPHPFCSGYSTSKAGIAMLSNQMALEWGPRGVRSNCVSPGFVRTELSEAFYSKPGVTEARSALVPARRIGTPRDIANAVLFLASDLATYVNGSNILVDGGLSQAAMSVVPRPGYDDVAA